MTRPLLLLVDDAPEIVLIVRRLGKWAGYDSVCCGDVPAAWEHLSAAGRKPDLLVVDLNLPGASGLELCRRLRGTPGLARVPVALFGSWDRPGELAAGVRAGVDFFLPKELLADPDAWRDRLGEILAGADGRSAPHSLSCGEGLTPLSSVEGWHGAIEQALQHPAVRRLGCEALRVLLQRAGAGWLLSEDLRLGPTPAAFSASPELVKGFAAALSGELGHLCGAAVRNLFDLTLKNALLARSLPWQ